ncbi:calcium binding egf domain-containing protein [Cardiosporidium cionae]|uniref:Calcium binding egf domain-containing protein n=1 Tax=Cardiosporidium cionae TaxID=476202 RepID=A0ABQ7JGB0_9APIC|nr:calcium binding egf domain-containing protein [Cardiosporidium cionae]|eukprot:KAF8823032.1 calcium binding egf domain-containing protein [Cardiosporidium cionae]
MFRQLREFLQPRTYGKTLLDEANSIKKQTSGSASKPSLAKSLEDTQLLFDSFVKTLRKNGTYDRSVEFLKTSVQGFHSASLLVCLGIGDNFEIPAFHTPMLTFDGSHGAEIDRGLAFVKEVSRAVQLASDGLIRECQSSANLAYQKFQVGKQFIFVSASELSYGDPSNVVDCTTHSNFYIKNMIPNKPVWILIDLGTAKSFSSVRITTAENITLRNFDIDFKKKNPLDIWYQQSYPLQGVIFKSNSLGAEMISIPSYLTCGNIESSPQAPGTTIEHKCNSGIRARYLYVKSVTGIMGLVNIEVFASGSRSSHEVCSDSREEHVVYAKCDPFSGIMQSDHRLACAISCTTSADCPLTQQCVNSSQIIKMGENYGRLLFSNSYCCYAIRPYPQNTGIKCSKYEESIQMLISTELMGRVSEQSVTMCARPCGIFRERGAPECEARFYEHCAIPGEDVAIHHISNVPLRSPYITGVFKGKKNYCATRPAIVLDAPNRCREGTHLCQGEATCSARPNSEYTCTCNQGYIGNGIKPLSESGTDFGSGCQAIDQCLIQNGNGGMGPCDPNAICENNGLAGIDCICRSPHYKQKSKTKCTDIDECAVNNGGCNTNADCTNKIGDPNPICNCRAGYTGDGVTCTDIDECAINHGDCDPNAACINLIGKKPICRCNRYFSGDGHFCRALFACDVGGRVVCLAEAQCSYISLDKKITKCTCPYGFTGDGRVTGSGCSDIDECATQNGGCHEHATCTNFKGGFECKCNTNYSGDGFNCEAIAAVEGFNKATPNPHLEDSTEAEETLNEETSRSTGLIAGGSIAAAILLGVGGLVLARIRSTSSEEDRGELVFEGDRFTPLLEAEISQDSEESEYKTAVHLSKE